MGDYDRRVLDSRRTQTFLTVKGNVYGNIEIDKGDLLFLDQEDDIRNNGSSTASRYVYPFSKISGSTGTLASNKTLAKDNFIGVAAWHSDSGVTESIAIYVSGLFNFGLKNARRTKVGYHVVPVGSGTTLYSQKVGVELSSGNRIGTAGDGGSFRNSIYVRIHTIMTPYFN